MDIKDQPIKTRYQSITNHTIVCRCGAICKTSNVEYFCPHCRTLLVNSLSHTGTAHEVYKYLVQNGY